MYTIVGYTKNSGTIKETGKAWTNYDVHCTYTPDKEEKNLFGSSVKTRRVSQAVMQAFSDEVGGQIIGQNVQFVLDERTYNGTTKIVVTDIIPVE